MDGEAFHMAIKRRLVPKRLDPHSPISTAQGEPSEVCFKDLHDRVHLAQLLELFKGHVGALKTGPTRVRKRFYKAVATLRVSVLQVEAGLEFFSGLKSFFSICSVL